MAGIKGRSGTGNKSPETIAKMKIASKKRWENSEYRNNHIKLMQKRYNYMRNRPPEEHPLFNKPVNQERIIKRLNTIKERYGKLIPWNKGQNKHINEKIRISGIKGGGTRKKLYAEGKIQFHHVFGKGENHPFFNNWSSLEPYDKKFNKQFKEIIRFRDNYLCQLCGRKDNRTLNIHHINYDKKFTIQENCISLCKSCHSKTQVHHKFWIEYFDNLLNDRGYGFTGYSDEDDLIINIYQRR